MRSSGRRPLAKGAKHPGGRPTDARVVGARVDWLEVAFRVEPDEEVLRELRARGAEAIREDAATAITLGEHGFPVEAWMPDALATEPIARPVYGKIGMRDFEMLRPSKPGKWLLRNRLMRVEVNERAPGGDPDGSPGWTVRVNVSGTALLELGHRGAVLEAWAVAASVGRVYEARFGRLDLCADVAGYHLKPDDRWFFVKQRRVKSADCFHDGVPRVRRKKRTTIEGETVREDVLSWHVDGRRIVDDDEAGHVEMYGGDTFTGFCFGSRTTMSARIYDKPLQLRAQAQDKRAAEEAVWRANGWAEGEDVARVEFEFRGEALEELEMRCSTRPETGGGAAHADRLAAALDGAWAYATQKWLRLRKKGDCEVAPKWRAVQGATFVEAAAPRARHRRRHFAKAAQARGAVMGFVAGQGEMPPVPWQPKVDEATGEVDARRRGVERSELVKEYLAPARGPEEAEAMAQEKLTADVTGLFLIAAKGLVKAEVDRAGGDSPAALSRFWTQWHAVLARVGPDYDGGEAIGRCVA